jgi:hypothetical protein
MSHLQLRLVPTYLPDRTIIYLLNQLFSTHLSEIMSLNKEMLIRLCVELDNTSFEWMFLFIHFGWCILCNLLLYHKSVVLTLMIPKFSAAYYLAKEEASSRCCFPVLF